MISRRLLGGLAMAGLARPAGATPGLSVFEMAEPSGEPGVALRVFVYRPAAWRPADQAIIVLHGQGRDADRYIAQWAPQAEATGLLVIAPEFSQRKYPGVAAYNWGNVVTEAGTPNPPAAWIFGAIDRIWAAAREKTGATQAGYALFGHSAGAQFVHRYLLLAEASQATTIITANAGSYTMPDRAIGFPFGLGNTSVTDAMLARALARPVTVLLGSEDIDPNHPALPCPASPVPWRKGSIGWPAGCYFLPKRGKRRPGSGCVLPGDWKPCPALRMIIAAWPPARPPSRARRRRDDIEISTTRIIASK